MSKQTIGKAMLILLFILVNVVIICIMPFKHYMIIMGSSLIMSVWITIANTLIMCDEDEHDS